MSLRLSPSILLTVLQPWTEIVEPIYRRIARMVDADDWGETLWIGCGTGRSVLWWAQKFNSITQGLDPDPKAIESAEARVRGNDLSRLVTFQVADPTNLPHEDNVFDSVVVHTLYMRDVDLEIVLKEAVRVLRPMGNVVVIAPSWLQTPREQDAKAMESLGFSPHLPVEWKGYLRNAGAVELTVEEASKDGVWSAPSLFSLVVRGWHAAGWVGARAMLSREVLALRRLVRKRVLGLSLLKGARWPHN